MNQSRLMLLAVAVGAVLLVVSQTFYIVDQRSQALIIRLGEVVRVVNAPGEDKPGLQAKFPFVESYVLFDKRNQSLEALEREVIASDQERLVVDAYLRYRIRDPLRFYKSLGAQDVAGQSLLLRLNAALREELGRASSDAIISDQRPAMMRAIRDNLSRQARVSRLGIEVIDVRIRRADLPQANQAAVYSRMEAARKQDATRIRAEGAQQKREIIATATGDAERIRGEGDAERAKLFAESFGKDPQFAAFYRSMRAYETSMGQGDATLVLSPDSEFFKYFGRGPGAQ
ncbi:MAG TPA: protease modulator HflC [Caulobacter sp.]|nr:protease modulator HflC [Caulobacter sp.]